ncbi:hypothetical protein HDU76_013286 [Blyttiomyces sp. JEL0837]|nr:hypothetical protein HDU76_013286 [Blyttiomyces sp. JEL0837]
MVRVRKRRREELEALAAKSARGHHNQEKGAAAQSQASDMVKVRKRKREKLEASAAKSAEGHHNRQEEAGTQSQNNQAEADSTSEREMQTNRRKQGMDASAVQNPSPPQSLQLQRQPNQKSIAIVSPPFSEAQLRKSPILKLHTPVLLYLFSYFNKTHLKQIRQVCRNWWLHSNNVFWETITFTGSSTWHIYNWSRTAHLLRRTHYAEVRITTQDLEKCKGIPTYINKVLRKCVNLRAVLVNRIPEHLEKLFAKLDHAVLDRKRTLTHVDLFPYYFDPKNGKLLIAKVNGDLAKSLLNGIQLDNLRHVNLNMDGMDLDNHNFPLASLRQLQKVEKINVTITKQFLRFPISPLLAVMSNLPLNIQKLGLLLNPYFLLFARQEPQTNPRVPPNVVYDPPDGISFPHPPLKVQVLHITLIRNQQMHQKFDDAFKQRLVAFIQGFFPCLREIVIRCGAMRAAFKLKSTWNCFSRMETFEPEYDYTAVIRTVAETLRWHMACEAKGGIQHEPQSPLYDQEFYRHLVSLRLQADELMVGILKVADPKTPANTLTPAFLERLQCLTVIPYGNPAKITKLLWLLFKYCRNITYLSCPPQLSGPPLDQFCEALAGCKRLTALKITKQRGLLNRKAMNVFMYGLEKIVDTAPLSLKNLEVPRDILHGQSERWVKKCMRRRVYLGDVKEPYQLMEYPTRLQGL